MRCPRVFKTEQSRHYSRFFFSFPFFLLFLLPAGVVLWIWNLYVFFFTHKKEIWGFKKSYKFRKIAENLIKTSFKFILGGGQSGCVGDTCTNKIILCPFVDQRPHQAFRFGNFIKWSVLRYSKSEKANFLVGANLKATYVKPSLPIYIYTVLNLL